MFRLKHSELVFHKMVQSVTSIFKLNYQLSFINDACRDG